MARASTPGGSCGRCRLPRHGDGDDLRLPGGGERRAHRAVPHAGVRACWAGPVARWRTSLSRARAADRCSNSRRGRRLRVFLRSSPSSEWNAGARPIVRRSCDGRVNTSRALWRHRRGGRSYERWRRWSIRTTIAIPRFLAGGAAVTAVTRQGDNLAVHFVGGKTTGPAGGAEVRYNIYCDGTLAAAGLTATTWTDPQRRTWPRHCYEVEAVFQGSGHRSHTRTVLFRGRAAQVIAVTDRESAATSGCGTVRRNRRTDPARMGRPGDTLAISGLTISRPALMPSR